MYVHHRISASPRQWDSVSEMIVAQRRTLAAAGGSLYGLWRSQIGRPRDEVTAITVWPDAIDTAGAEAALLQGVAGVVAATSEGMTPTLRPDAAGPPTRQGNYAFRWFVTPQENWDEFLTLCAEAWPGFESAYDSQVIGLWRCARTGDGVRSLLLTRRPDLAMWERSKIPQGAAEVAVRDTLNRRYDLCSWTVVYTTTLLTATDTADRSRWA